MAYQLDPERIYINMTAAAGNTQTVLSPAPVATYQERRFAPVVSDLSKYKLAVVRADLNGTRNFPVFMPAIAPRQYDPALTCYGIQATLDVYSPAAAVTTLPTTGPFYLSVTSFNASGATKTPWTCLTLNATSGQTMGSWATAITNAIKGIDATDPVLFNMSVTVLTGAGGGVLQFQSAGGGGAAGWSFQISVGLGAGAPSDLPPNAAAFGLSKYDVPSATAAAYLLGSSESTSTPGTLTVVTPNPAFAKLPVKLGTYTDTGGMTYVRWISQSGMQLPAVSASGEAAADSPAYWMFDYEWWVGLFNKALVQTTNAALGLAATAGYVFVSSDPYLVFNPSSKTFTLYLDANLNPSLSQPIGVDTPGKLPNTTYGVLTYTVSSMMQDLMLFPAKYSESGVATLNTSQAHIVDAPYPSGAINTATPMVALSNDFTPTSSLWSPVESLVFQSQLLPVRSEIISAPVLTGQSGVGYGLPVSTAYDSIQILTDVIPAQSDASDWRTQPVIYAPTVLRWVDLPCGALALSALDFSLAWRNARTGTVTPIRMNAGSNFSVKILLLRRDVIY